MMKQRSSVTLAVAQQLLIAALLLAGFVFLRLLTLRLTTIPVPVPAAAALRSMQPVGADRNGASLYYNHRETDEVIFQSLIQQVQSDWRDYTLLGKPLQQQLRLAEENYNHGLFIHPPLFVYTSAALNKWLWPALPLPLHAVLFQVIALVATGAVCWHVIAPSSSADARGLGSNSNSADCSSSAEGRISCCVWAMILIMCCPIAAFCSQKIWIDNALLMGVSVSAALHMQLLSAFYDSDPRQQQQQQQHWGLLVHAFSGLLFGLLALNCKVTAAALLPFLLAWIAVKHCEHTPRRRAILRNADFVPLFWKSGAFVSGAALAHGPWLLVYRVQIS